jgi:hypothetical protein
VLERSDNCCGSSSGQGKVKNSEKDVRAHTGAQKAAEFQGLGGGRALEQGRGAGVGAGTGCDWRQASHTCRSAAACFAS